MTAVRVQEQFDAARAAASSSRPRRAGSATRPGNAAGQQRRSLERNLARREAALRISRRVSGPAGGISRPAPQQPPAQPPTVSPEPIAVERPGDLAPVAAPPRPASTPRTANDPPAVRTAAIPARTPQPRGGTPRPAARAGRPAAARTRPEVPVRADGVTPRGVDLRVPTVAGRASAPATVSAEAAIPEVRQSPQQHAPRRLVVLTGTAAQSERGSRRRLSTAAVVLSALVAIVLTVGVVVAAQIRVTQMNEQIGRDLGQISRLQQATVAQKERISSLVTSARIDDEAERQQLIEPDPVDVTYLETGDRTKIAARAAQILRSQPVTPVGGVKPTTPTASTATSTASASTVIASPTTTTP
ncbi:MAG: hypothetical protein QM679_10495 [Patulibacter sp.]